MFIGLVVVPCFTSYASATEVLTAEVLTAVVMAAVVFAAVVLMADVLAAVLAKFTLIAVELMGSIRLALSAVWNRVGVVSAVPVYTVVLRL